MGGPYLRWCSHNLCSDGDVVHINTNKSTQGVVFGDHLPVYIIHEGLEGGWRVAKAKHHDLGLVEATTGFECGFVGIGLLDANIIVSLSYIELSVQACAPEVSDEVADEG